MNSCMCVRARVLSFSRRDNWGFLYYWIRRCISGWIIPDVSKERIAFIFKGNLVHSSWNSWPFTVKTVRFFETSGVIIHLRMPWYIIEGRNPLVFIFYSRHVSLKLILGMVRRTGISCLQVKSALNWIVLIALHGIGHELNMPYIRFYQRLVL
jgi:hypothetical protein